MPVVLDLFEKTIAKRFRLESAPTLFAGRGAHRTVGFTRLQSDGPYQGPSLAFPPEDAFACHVAVGAMANGAVTMGSRHYPLASISPGDALLVDLASNPFAELRPPFDFVRFYLPTSIVDELASSEVHSRITGLRQAVIGASDPILFGLAHAVLPALGSPLAHHALFLDGVALAFAAHMFKAYGGAPLPSSKTTFNLSGWQMRRIEDYAEAHLAANPTVADFARECRLSSSHFTRAFTQTIGTSPHRWLLVKRVEKAKSLILKGDHGIAEIALACGFSDQSHLSKVFKRHEGCGPGQWRRLHGAQAA